MRVLVLCHEYPPVGGGAGASCALLSEEFAAAGHQVDLFTMQLGKLPATEVINGVSVTRVDCGRRRQEMASPWEALRWARRVWQPVAQRHLTQPYDLTYAHFVMPAGLIARRLQRQHGVPYVVIPRGSDVPGYNRERLRLAHALARPWWRRIVREAEAVLSPSRYLLELLMSCESCARGQVIPNAIRYQRFPVGIKTQRILLCSRLVERKGLQHVLQALQGLDLPGWEVDLVGTGPAEGELRRLAQDVRIPVHFQGWINNRDPRLSELYARASLFALPSAAENCPVAILEAMAAGCAVITSNITGNPEVLGETGITVAPGDVIAIRTALLKLTADSELRTDLGRSAHQRVVEHFSPAVLLKRHLAVCEQILAHRRAPV